MGKKQGNNFSANSALFAPQAIKPLRGKSIFINCLLMSLTVYLNDTNKFPQREISKSGKLIFFEKKFERKVFYSSEGLIKFTRLYILFCSLMSLFAL